MQSLHAFIATWLNRIWYQAAKPPWYLSTLAWFYDAWLSRQAPLPELTRTPMPIIVVGNVVVGGGGKTPLVIQNIKVIVIARLYSGNADGPMLVRDNSSTLEVGDEPKLLQKRLNCPIVVSRSRSKSIDFIVKNKLECDIVISDDGLQHMALPRAIEIGVVDTKRGIGNGKLLPAGPLREPVDRFQRCQWLIEKCQQQQGQNLKFKNTLAMQINIVDAINLHTNERISLTEFAHQKDTSIHMLAAIADPEAFFNALTVYGIEGVKHAMTDHAKVDLERVETFRTANIVLMTAKDAVKWSEVQPPLKNIWYVPLYTELPENFEKAFLQRCKALLN